MLSACPKAGNENLKRKWKRLEKITSLGTKTTLDGQMEQFSH